MTERFVCRKRHYTVNDGIKSVFYFRLAVYLVLYEEALLDVNTHNLNRYSG